MSTFYSDAMSEGGVSKIVRVKDIRSRTVGQKRRTSIYKVTALALTTDLIRMGTVSSGIRIVEMYISGGNEAAAGDIDIGLHRAEEQNGGTVIDANLFAVAVAKNAARVDAFDESTTLDDQDRGKPLWDLANTGGGTYTEDPSEVWDITITPGTSHTTTANSYTLEIIYIEG